MALRTPNIVITSIDTITAFDSRTGDLRWMIDELQSAELIQEETFSELLGRRGQKFQILKQDKSVRLTATNGFFSTDLLSSQLGAKYTNKLTKVAWADFMEVQSHKAKTEWVAFGTPGAEIPSLFIRNRNGTLGKQLYQAPVASDGHFAYDPTTKVITFGNDVPDFSIVVAYYQRQIRADVMASSINNETEKLALYIDAMAQDVCDNLYHVQIYMPRVDHSGRVTMELGGDQTVHTFEANALPGNCGAKGMIWTYTLFGGAAEQDPNTPFYLGIGKLDINALG